MLAAPALSHEKHYDVKVEAGDVYVRAAAREKPTPRAGTESQTFVIVGGGAAGNAAAETLREEGFMGRVVVVTPEKHLPYDRPNLSKDFLSGKAKAEWIPLRTEKFYADRKIEFMMGSGVRAVDPMGRKVTLDNGSALSWDRLLLATGGKARRLAIPGADLENVFTLRTRQDAEHIVTALGGKKKAVVIGASFIGMEAAAALRQRGMEVHVVGPEELPLARVFGEEVAQWIKGVHEAEGVSFHLRRTPTALKGDGRVSTVELDDGTTLEAEIVLTGIGITPIVDYLEGTGLMEGGVVPVNDQLETRAAGIFAAGDIAAVPYPATGGRIRVEHWVVAERQGQHAARAMLGPRDPYREVPFFWTHQYDYSLTYAGHAERWDRIAWLGTPGDKAFLAGYFEGERLRAVCSFRRDRDFMKLMQKMRSGEEIGPDDFPKPKQP